ncbi:hypothetical protein BGX27_008375 [Mortierella sp. AM989]|nr:hypothetical protein BGX27_008375 [Mortierella sp. AM989]
MRKSWSPSLAFGLSFLKAYLHYSEYLTIEEIQGRSRSIPFMTAPFGIRVHKIKVPVVPYRIKAESMVNDCLTVEEKELVYPRMKFDNCKNSLTRNQNNFNPHGHGAGDKRLKDLNAEWLESTGADIETGTETPNENYGAVIYFHGGGYYTGSKEEHRVLLGPLVKRLGKKIRVLNVGYRLAPQDPFPAALVDALSCYMWVMDQSVSEVFGLDNPEIGRNDRFQPNQIVFMGDSAGSGLVFSLCLLLRDHNTIPQPLAVVAWSPWLDLTQSLPSFEEHGPTDCIPYENFVHKHSAAVDQMFESQEKCCGEDGEPSTELKVRQRAQLYCPDSCLRIKYVSPLFETDFRGITDIFITCGSAERFYNECVLMAAHLEQQQQSCRIDIHEEMPHIFQLFRYHPSASTSLDRSSDYIREMVNRDVERSDEGNIVIPINPSSSSSSSGSASPALSSVSYERSMTNPASTDISGGQEIRHEADIIPPSIQRTNSSLSATSATPEGSTATVASVHPEKQSLLSRHSNRGTGMKTTVNVVDQSGICVVNNIKKRDSFGSIGISGLGKTSSARERRNLTLRDIVTDARLYKWEILLKQGSVPTRHWPDHR